MLLFNTLSVNVVDVLLNELRDLEPLLRVQNDFAWFVVRSICSCGGIASDEHEAGRRG